ncbi:hypothetical protein COLO4_30917 [Corchorus olitorius]|uniref:Uncharacterized protein n=1 Tax=Corchorus olitorius TaxID=93759 RepID=A0A1R3H6D5_9ROSI|nr:hypothetical protein COLO4_30917 [Corchorus olitorius]
MDLGFAKESVTKKERRMMKGSPPGVGCGYRELTAPVLLRSSPLAIWGNLL